MMYRSKNILSKKTTNALVCRPHGAPPLAIRSRIVEKHEEFVRFMSTDKGGGNKLSMIWPTLGLSVGALGLLGVYAGWNDEFRRSVISKPKKAYHFLKSSWSNAEEDGIEVVDSLPTLTPPVQTEVVVTDLVNKAEENIALDNSGKVEDISSEECLVINVMDTSSPSQIDFVVGKEPSSIIEDEAITEMSGSDVGNTEEKAVMAAVNLEGSVINGYTESTECELMPDVEPETNDDVATVNSEEACLSGVASVDVAQENEPGLTALITERNTEDCYDAQNKIIESNFVQDVLSPVTETENVEPQDVILEAILKTTDDMFSDAPASAVQDVVENEIVNEMVDDEVFLASTITGEDTAVIEGGLVASEVPSFVQDKLNKEQQSHILQAAYENLQIIFDDTITTKTSAAGMLKGYLSRLGQELLIAKDDPLYVLSGETNSVLDLSIQESIDLVHTKESELSIQIRHTLDIIDDIREDGSSSDIADRTEELIASSNESLSWVESEIALLSSKVKFLVNYQKHIQQSSGVLKTQLRDLVPDLIKLLTLKQVDVQNLSYEDALMFLSLKRIELIYSELQENEKVQLSHFESVLKKKLEESLRDANDHINVTVNGVVTAKNNELTEAVKELYESHDAQLCNTLEEQQAWNEQDLHNKMTKRRSDLMSQYSSEVLSKLNDQDDKQYLEIRSSLFYLDGIESKVPDLHELDKKARINMNLWAAINAINVSLIGVSDNGRTKDLREEMTKIRLNCSDNEVVSNILATIPEAAMRGVIPQNSLVDQFHHLKSLCKRVAMVKDETESVFSYIFSYIKSVCVLKPKLRSDDMNPETLGPYGILEKAEQCVMQGQLEEAARLMSQLNGVPRKLADDWLKEVRLYVETKQSVDLLMAYVVGSNC